MESNRGEDQPRLFIFIFVMMALGAFVTLIVGVTVTATTRTSNIVLQDQEKLDLYSQAVTNGLYSVASVRYTDQETAACTVGTQFTRPITVHMRFRTTLTPDTCSFFVNDKLLLTERRLEPECGSACPFGEFTRQVSLGEFDYRDTHKIRVCCNDICTDRTVVALC